MLSEIEFLTINIGNKTFKKMKTRNFGLICSGCIISVIGLAHTIFPTYGYSDEVQDFFKKSPLMADHFFYLATYAICSFLLFIGAVTIYVGASIEFGKNNSKFISYYTVLSIALWSGRLLLEIKYPVRLSLFKISEPTNNLVIVLSLIVIGFTVGLFTNLKLSRASS